MIVLVVSECVNRAWERSRRVLDRYLERVGERTWRGRITREGLADLREGLLAVASKHTAVAAHVVDGSHGFRFEWLVGSSHHFDDQGRRSTYAGGAYDAHLVAPRAAIPNAVLISAVLALAGLWHDVGKANPYFQDKLARRAAEADPIRHELLSALAFIDVVRALHPFDDLTEDRVRKAILGAMGPRVLRHDSHLDLTPTHVDAARSSPMPEVLRRVAWLIATHHRLPDADNPVDVPIDLAARYRATHHVTVTRENPVTPAVGILPGVVTDGLVRGTATLLADLVALGDDVVTAALPWSLVAVQCRLALILADRLVSMRVPSAPVVTASLMANASQNLDDHLRAVSEAAVTSLSDVVDAARDFPALVPANLPRHVRQTSAGRFAWQNRAEATAAEMRLRTDGRRGAFLVISSSTGSGKTRAVPRVMAALGPVVRYTLALPQRNVTAQTGDVYRREMGLSRAEVAVIAGGTLDAAKADTDAPSFGSESADDAVAEVDVLDEVDIRAFALPGFVVPHVRDEPRTRRMLSAPIVVSTVDQVIGAADMRRTGHLGATLRIASSDLVIDEADAFDDADMIVVGRLVFVAGALGRSVVLTSATVTPEQSGAFLAAYLSGREAYAALTGASPEVVAGFASDVPGTDVVRVVTSHEDVGQIFVAPSHVVAEHVAVAPALRHGRILAVRSLSRADVDDALVDGLRRLHADHAVVDPVSGRRLSRLLVRVGRVATCVQVARMLGARFPSGDVRIVVHHARFVGAARLETERFLDVVMRRTHEDVPHEGRLRRWLSGAPTGDAMLVVVATGVIESGNDYDFDGAVVEPTSTRSVTQTVGRVMRHRWGVPATPNVLILPTTFRYVDDPTRPLSYSRPGVEETVAASKVSIGHSLRGGHMFADLVRAEDVVSLTACPLLTMGDVGELTSLERRRTADYLGSVSCRSLRGYHSGSARGYLSSRHADEVRFRSGPGDMSLFLDATAHDRRFRDHDGGDLDHVLGLDPGPAAIIYGLVGFSSYRDLTEGSPLRDRRVNVPAHGGRLVYSDAFGAHRR